MELAFNFITSYAVADKSHRSRFRHIWAVFFAKAPKPTLKRAKGSKRFGKKHFKLEFAPRWNEPGSGWCLKEGSGQTE